MTVTGEERRLGDRYVLGPVIGRGGAAVVHEAVDTRLHRPVAVKLLSGVNSAELERHSGELAALARPSHPDVVVLHDAGADDGTSWLVLELVRGQTLADRVRAGPLDAAEVARIGGHVARGLAAAHAAGVVHRDVKPGTCFSAMTVVPRSPPVPRLRRTPPRPAAPAHRRPAAPARPCQPPSPQDRPRRPRRQPVPSTHAAAAEQAVPAQEPTHPAAVHTTGPEPPVKAGQAARPKGNGNGKAKTKPAPPAKHPGMGAGATKGGNGH